MSLHVGARLGPYEIGTAIGAGGMGEVYLAQDVRLKRRVALKILPPAVVSSPDRRSRFEHEAQAAAALNHPNICTIFDVGEADGQPFIAMEYCEGTTLTARLQAGVMKVPEVVDLATQIADALNEAHRRRVLHRDIKSANILVTPRGQIKILDFGLAKDLPADDAGLGATETAAGTDAGVVMGTVDYMSPEQALGRPLDARSDLFSFGVVLYEMLAGKLPFGGQTYAQHLDSVLHHDPPPLDGLRDHVPEALARLVRRMLEKDPERRTQSAREIWNDLREIRDSLAPGTATVARAALAPPTRSWTRRWPAWAALVVVLGAGAGVWLWQSHAGRVVPEASRGHRLVLLPATVIAPKALEADYAYLSEAVPRTLYADLAAVEGLDMQTPPSTAQIAQVGGEISRVMKAYDADLYLESDITADKTQLSWSVRLVEWPSKVTKWKKSYPGQEATYLQMVHQAADEIHGSLVPERRAALRAISSSSSSAIELEFQDGVFYSRRFTAKGDPADFGRAAAALTHVFSEDRARTDAAAEMAYLIVRQIEFQGRTDDQFREASGWAQKGLDVDPRCGLCLAAESAVLRYDPKTDYSTRLDTALRAARFGPNVPAAHRALGVTLSDGGAPASVSLAATRAASHLVPMDTIALNNIGYFFFVTGDSGESVVALERLLSIHPDDLYGRLSLIPSLADVHRINDAEAMLRKLESMAPERQPVVWMPVMRAIVQLERQDSRASATLSSIRAAMPAMASSDVFEIAVNLAPSLIRRGRVDDVFALLTVTLDRGAPTPYEWLMFNPSIVPLQNDVRFKRFADASRGQHEKLVGLLNDARRRGILPGYLEAPLAEATARLTQGATGRGR